MDRKLWLFTAAALALALTLAAFVSPFASESPDGLDHFAEAQRIDEGDPAWADAPMADYQVPTVSQPAISKGLAGVIGTLGVFGVSLLVGWMISRGTPARGKGDRA